MSKVIDDIIGGSAFQALIKPKAQVLKVRKCLGCGKSFKSKGIGNKVCAKCAYAREGRRIAKVSS